MRILNFWQKVYKSRSSRYFTWSAWMMIFANYFLPIKCQNTNCLGQHWKDFISNCYFMQFLHNCIFSLSNLLFLPFQVRGQLCTFFYIILNFNVVKKYCNLDFCIIAYHQIISQDFTLWLHNVSFFNHHHFKKGRRFVIWIGNSVVCIFCRWVSPVMTSDAAWTTNDFLSHCSNLKSLLGFLPVMRYLKKVNRT